MWCTIRNVFITSSGLCWRSTVRRDILWSHTCSVCIFSEGVSSSLQMFLNSPGSCGGPVAELRRMMEGGWRGTDLPHGETRSLHWKWLNSRKQGSWAGCQGWERATWVQKGTLTKSVSFPGKWNSQVQMELQYLDTHVLKNECFAGWDLACPYVSKLFLSASSLIETWTFWELIDLIAMETNSVSLGQSCYLWFAESASNRERERKRERERGTSLVTFAVSVPLLTALCVTSIAKGRVQQALQGREAAIPDTIYQLIIPAECQISGFDTN